jgi:hypothetical protein
MLLPQQDGIAGIASYTLPIKFKDLTEIKDFIEAAQHQTIDFIEAAQHQTIESIYYQHKKLWEKFVVTGKTPRTIDGNTSSRASRPFEIFGFKIFGSEVALDDRRRTNGDAVV